MKIALPTDRFNLLRIVGPAALVIILLLPPLLVNVHKPPPTRMMEAVSFLSSQETWLQMHSGNSDAWQMPTLNGKPRIEKPPLLVWLNLMAWHGLTPDTAGVEPLVLRARLVGLALALVAVLGIYWAGMTLGGVRLATLAALFTGSAFFFIRQARYASYDTHIMGWVTLAVAAGLWAIRADTHRPLRTILGWTVCVLALAAANYTKGPLGFAFVVIPLAAAVAVFPERRRANAACLAAATVAALAAFVPWFMFAARVVPEAGERFGREYQYILEALGNPLFYFSIIGLVFPWTLWLAGGLVAPFADHCTKRDRGYWFAWAWLVLLLLLLSLSPVKNKRYVVPALPPAGLLIAFFWVQMERLVPDAGRWLTGMRRIHWGVLLALSLILPLFVILQPFLLSSGILHRAEMANLPTLACIATGVLLAAAAWVGMQAHRRGSLFSAGAATAAWMIVASTFGYWGYSATDRHTFAQRAETEHFARSAAGHRVFFVSRFQLPHLEAMPSQEFLIYYRGVVPQTTLNDALAMARDGNPLFLMTRLESAEEAALDAGGFARAGILVDGHSPEWTIWKSREL
jgi:4-amino-4-deoxy-L-arabinose transferase-like glycosyltransferase